MKPNRPTFRLRPSLAILLALGGLAAGAQAQNYPVTPQQRATAQQAAQAGVPLSELSPNAPDEYTVRPGDTLWAISRLFLRSPWRWPELWGMNMGDIANPHRIFPGQVLFLDKSGGRARLSTRRGGDGGTIKVTPRTRAESLSGVALPTLNPSLIEPFLSEPLVVDEDTLSRAPRIVAGNDERVLLSRGDRAYARSSDGTMLREVAGASRQYRVFREATPLKDPATGEILGYEAQYLGKAILQRSESTQADDRPETETRSGGSSANASSAEVCGNCPPGSVSSAPAAEAVSNVPPGMIVVPATVDIAAAREEIRAGDRLLPEPPRTLVSYVPRAPEQAVSAGRIVSVYGNAVRFAAQNQVVAINKGTRDGIASGHVLAILKNGATIVDKTGGAKETLKLPNERIGLLMVFRPFEKVSYALVLEINDTPRAGDLLVNP